SQLIMDRFLVLFKQGLVQFIPAV
ncbi:hypothetical protein A5876_000215, partial [Enterococcus sp. 3C8_DIV0646]